MAKKNKELETTNTNKPAKDNKNKKQQPKVKRDGLGKKLKESTSELKKVTWPSFGKTVKQTGVVIAVVVVCTLVLFGIDRLLSLLYKVLT